MTQVRTTKQFRMKKINKMMWIFIDSAVIAMLSILGAYLQF
jgi:hypothetical protein